ncbi:MAG: hypothetical protein AAFU61_15330, partial [Pseudomonadota bacterium]
RDRGVRRLPAEALPLIWSSPEGRRLLAAAGSGAGAGALTVGAPADRCPARAAGEGATPLAAAEASIRACFAQLAEAGADPDCGCRTLAAGDAALAERGAYAYAPGVSARLVSRDLGVDLTFAAREAEDEEGRRRLELIGAGAAPLTVALDGAGGAGGAGGARLNWRGVWRGPRRAEGLTRGRFRERFVLTREGDGARLTLAVGWEPAAYAADFRRLERPIP